MTNKTSNQEKGKFTGKHFLVWILGFFTVVIAINIAFIFLATDTWTGLSSKTAYVDGLKYNQTLEAVKNQRALGWHNTLTLTKTGQQHSLDFTLEDRDGTALSGFTVTALVGRPTLQKYDQTVTLGESAKGTYQAALDLPLLGQWHISLKAIGPDGTSYQLEQRFIVK
ncbi:FixH family protein [Kiloniella laminariae]|uniref:FixH family protein n=1 Tax=Kiloniella laminariae TaxID=454162 RepID=A0ABT4LG80_9PROT|nr:FixH family protein [Kiloniella laminariae]MCZ4280113.1 FixH family protein [Kiloniella laminariae]